MLTTFLAVLAAVAGLLGCAGDPFALAEGEALPAASGGGGAAGASGAGGAGGTALARVPRGGEGGSGAGAGGAGVAGSGGAEDEGPGGQGGAAGAGGDEGQGGAEAGGSEAAGTGGGAEEGGQGGGAQGGSSAAGAGGEGGGGEIACAWAGEHRLTGNLMAGDCAAGFGFGARPASGPWLFVVTAPGHLAFYGWGDGDGPGEVACEAEIDGCHLDAACVFHTPGKVPTAGGALFDAPGTVTVTLDLLLTGTALGGSASFAWDVPGLACGLSYAVPGSEG